MTSVRQLRDLLERIRARVPGNERLAGTLDRALSLARDLEHGDMSRELEVLRDELESQQRWVEALLDSMPQPLLLIEPGSARVTFANAAADRVAGGKFPTGKPASEYHTVYTCTDAEGRRIPDEAMPGVRAARGEVLEGYEMDLHTKAGVASLLVYGSTLPAMRGHAATVVMPFVDVTALKRSELAGDVGRLLASTLELETSLPRVAERITRRFADVCVIELNVERGGTRTLAFSHADPSRAGPLEELLTRHRGAVAAIPRPARPGEVIELPNIDEAWLRSVSKSDDEYEALRALEIRNGVLVSLEARGNVVGVLALGRLSRRIPFDAREIAAAREIASRIALHIDNTRLFRGLERANQHLVVLQELTEAALSEQSSEQLGRSAVAGVRAALAADTAALLMARDDNTFELAAVDGLAGEHEREIRMGIHRGIAGEVLAARTPRIVEDVASVDVVRPFLHEAGIKQLMVAPLRSGDRAIGVLHVGTRSDRAFADDELRLLQLLADRLAVGIERLRLFEAERSARAEAEAANRLKDEFLATLSHELRTPLNAIVGWTAMLQERAADPAVVAKGLATIERNAKSQAHIIDDLLDVSRIISGKLGLSLEEIDVRTQILAAADAVRPAADSRGVALKLEVADVGHVVVDPDRLQQIVWNLLSNAVKFTPKGGTVTVRADRHGGELRIEVQDTGVGIPPEELPYVFDRFRQVDSSSTRRHGGLGLGLAIVRHLVELHGGYVVARSPGPNRGTTFTVAMPVRAAPLETAPAEPVAAPPNGAAAHSRHADPLTGLRVLAVDDDEDARDLLGAVLSQYGADVATAASAKAAFETIGSFRPDVIVCDLGMPDEDGISFMRRVRELEARRGQRTPAIALTAYAREEDAARALSAGFQLHVSKPVEPAQIVACVASLGGRAPEATHASP